jgi:hypothetical protein
MSELVLRVRNGPRVDRRTVSSDMSLSSLSAFPTRARFWVNGEMICFAAFSFAFLGVESGATIVVEDPKEEETVRKSPTISDKARQWDLAKARIDNGKGYRRVVRCFRLRESRPPVRKAAPRPQSLK